MVIQVHPGETELELAELALKTSETELNKTETELKRKELDAPRPSFSNFNPIIVAVIAALVGFLSNLAATAWQGYNAVEVERKNFRAPLSSNT